MLYLERSYKDAKYTWQSTRYGLMDGLSIQRMDFICYNILSPIFESHPTINPLYTTNNLEKETIASSIQSIASKRRKGKNDNNNNDKNNRNKRREMTKTRQKKKIMTVIPTLPPTTTIMITMMVIIPIMGEGKLCPFQILLIAIAIMRIIIT